MKLLRLSHGCFFLIVVLLISTPTIIHIHLRDSGESSATAMHITPVTMIQNTISCDPTYILFRLWLYQGHLDNNLVNAFSKYGFTQKCSDNEINQFILNKEMITIKKNIPLCLKYGNKSNVYSKNNIFCNGEIIHYFDEKHRNLYELNIISKSVLNQILTKYCSTFDNNNENICNFAVLSFNMDNSKQRIEFLTKHINCTNNKSQNDRIWVLKEGGKKKHGGRGIHYYNNHQLIYQLITSNISEENTYYKNCKKLKPLQNETYFKKEGLNYYKYKINNSNYYIVNNTQLVIQKFISNPLLIENKRFHLRVPLLIPSLSNPFIVLYYTQGIIFRNPNQYDSKQLNSQSITTNYHWHVNKNNNWTFYWGYNRFQTYLNNVYDHKLENYTKKGYKLDNDIRHMTEHIFRANMYNNKLNKVEINNSKNKWIVLCIDIIINNKFEIKLLEVNRGCTAMNYCLDKTMIDNGKYEWNCNELANEMVEIIMEIYNKKYQNKSINNLYSLKNYKIALCE